jgi:hypothetical protein
MPIVQRSSDLSNPIGEPAVSLFAEGMLKHGAFWWSS